ncbi:MAG: MBL fold metallo-hydrolase [Proteobacteria bacterium]|nr:MBL fold metallo-hydrolase [Desulfobacula sp.]MBU3950546.1 MBL fold metallo-hydrolase [Pseudomonadota bacterium]MBU4129787.1 MBL fold metallo-hydrolase [Pseudomonadota bacterium]
MKKNLKHSCLTIFLVILLSFTPYAQAGSIKDSESASHSDAASGYDIVDTYVYPGFKIIQFNLAVLSHYSYMLISEKQAMVVDPGRDVMTYLQVAQKEGVEIAGVLLTHSHADFVAGHTEIAKAVGCPVYISAKAEAGYPHTPLKDGSTLSVGSATIKVLETPGHTLDCTTSIVYSENQMEKPLALFSGDTLFVGSIGRPDLMGGTISAAALASMSYDSWHEKLSRLNDDVTVYPAHGAGSLCGAHLSDDPFSTIGRERQTNAYLKHASRSDFIAAVLEGLPDAPQYFKYNAAMNKKGPATVDWNVTRNPVKPSASLNQPENAYIVDLRDAAAYAKGHIPNSVNIALRGRLETWVGIMVPWGSPLVLTGSREEIDEALFRLHRVGYTAEAMPFDDWVSAALPLKSVELMDPAVLYDAMKSGKAPVIVDVRLPTEWMGLRIGQVINMPLNQLGALSSKLDSAQPVVAVCNSAYRSSLALGILEQKGFGKATSLKGGSQAWIDAGYPVFGSDTTKTQVNAATVAKREIKMPSRMSPDQLKGLILDLPGSFDLVDIRPPSMFADFHLPQSVNIDIADLLSNPAYLVGTGPLIIVDRDGTLSLMAAGMLYQKTKREIKAVTGGLEAYWNQSGILQMSPASSGMISPMPSTPLSSPVPAGPPIPAPATPVPEKPKKKSAGC